MAVDSTTIGAGLESARAKIAGTIKNAASATGASFEYLISAAKIESNLNPKAQASTSSARGLYQFIEQTWLGTVKEAGAAFGFGKYADAISKSGAGRYTVADSAKRDEILKLRDDYKALKGDKYSARAFHDALLGNGTVPIWLHRSLMLGENNGSMLE